MSNIGTLSQKLFAAHELLSEVADCLNLNSELYWEIKETMQRIYTINRNLPRKLSEYVPG